MSYYSYSLLFKRSSPFKVFIPKYNTTCPVLRFFIKFISIKLNNKKILHFKKFYVKNSKTQDYFFIYLGSL